MTLEEDIAALRKVASLPEMAYSPTNRQVIRLLDFTNALIGALWLEGHRPTRPVLHRLECDGCRVLHLLSEDIA